MGVKTVSELVYLWTLQPEGIHSCYVVDSPEKMVRFLRTDLAPAEARFLVRLHNEPVDSLLLGQMLQFPPGSVFGPEHLVEFMFGADHAMALHNQGEEDDLEFLLKHLSLGKESGRGDTAESLLLEAVEYFVAGLTPRKREIFDNRLTGLISRSTLEETAQPFDITRERVRQLQVQIVKDFARKNNELLLDVAMIIDSISRAEEPFLVDSFGSQMPELRGLDQYWCLIVEAMPDSFRQAVHPIRLGSVMVFSRFSEEELLELIKSHREFVARHVQERGDLLVEEIRERLWDDLAEIQPGLLPLVLDEVLVLAHVMPNTEGEEVVVSYGRGANSAVLAALRSSPVPLTYEQVWQLLGEGFDVRRVHNSLQQNAILLGWGTYGLRQHISLSDS